MTVVRIDGGEQAMSDSYEALLDCSATPEQAAAQASMVVEVLSEAGLILRISIPSLLRDRLGRPLVTTFGRM